IYPIWGMVAMAASVTTIFINSLWSRGAYFFEAIRTVGHTPHIGPETQAEGDMPSGTAMARSPNSLTGDSGHV
ncbi:MAG: hypothetical protein WBQ86_22600, partial [Candidatus Binatus sp.]